MLEKSIYESKAYCILHSPFSSLSFHLVKLLMKDLILESANSMLPQEHQILMALNRITIQENQDTCISYVQCINMKESRSHFFMYYQLH